MNKLQALNEEAKKHPRPDLVEYGRVSDNDPVFDNDNETTRSAAKVDIAKPVTQSPVNRVEEGLNNVDESVDAGNKNLARNLQRMSFNDQMMNAQQVRALHAMNSNLVRIEDTLGHIYRMLKDERTRPRMQIYRRDGSKIDNTSKEAEPGNGDGSGGGLLDGLLGGAIAAAIGAKAKGVWDKIRGKAGPNPSTVDPEGRRVPTKPNGPARPAPSPVKPTTVEEPKVKGRVGAAADAVKGRVGAMSTAAGEAFERNRVKGRAGLIIAGGAAAVAGVGALMSSVDEASANAEEQRNITSTERAIQDARVARGLSPLEGEELTATRKRITENDGLIANPKTGFPLNTIQHEAVRAGLMTADEASRTDNEQIHKVMEAAKVPVSADAMSSVLRNGNNIDEPGLLDSTAGKVIAFGGGALVAHTAADALMKPKVNVDAPNAPPPAIAKPTTAAEAVKAPSTVQPTSAAQLARAQSLPNAQELTKVRAGIESAVASAGAEPPASIKKPGALSAGIKKGVPVLGTALTAYDVYNVVTDENASTKQKVGGVVDIAGGTAGAILGAKAGATGGAAIGAAIGSFFFGAGAVPGAAIGAAIGGIGGGIAGYMGGSAITQSAREWMFGPDDELTPEAQSVIGAQGAVPAGARSENPVVAQTEKAFDQIVEASRPGSNPWVQGVMTGAPVANAPAANKSNWSMFPTSTTPSAAPATSGGTNAVVPKVPNVTNIAQPAVSAPTPSVMSASSVTAAAPQVITAKAMNETQPVRNTYTEVVKTTSVDQKAPAERKRSTDTAKETLGNGVVKGKGFSSAPAISEVPTAVNESGLGLFNVGMY